MARLRLPIVGESLIGSRWISACWFKENNLHRMAKAYYARPSMARSRGEATVTAK